MVDGGGVCATGCKCRSGSVIRKIKHGHLIQQQTIERRGQNFKRDGTPRSCCRQFKGLLQFRSVRDGMRAFVGLRIAIVQLCGPDPLSQPTVGRTLELRRILGQNFSSFASSSLATVDSTTGHADDN
jgi:hypothetical protein